MATSPELLVPDLDGQGTIDQFSVNLPVFTGPFDLLLQLISRKKLDITDVALSEVTDEFIAYIASFPDLSQMTEFLVIAATLLNLKASHLLPRDEGEPDEDLEDLEARDLLFSRLLQYRAFKEASVILEDRLEENAGYVPRTVALEPQFAMLLPELIWRLTGPDLARIAADVFSHTPPTVDIAHLHEPVVPVHEQVLYLAEVLTQRGRASFHQLVADAGTTAMVVSRFLALLVLFRQNAVDFEQEEALGELTVIWNGNNIDVDEEWEDDE